MKKELRTTIARLCLKVMTAQFLLELDDRYRIDR